MAVYVGRWDCTTCGYKGIKGPESECNHCGADRPKDVKFYLADDSEIVQDPEALKRARSGADWECSYCGENNQAFENKCMSCGNNRDASDGDKSLKTKTYYNNEVPRTGDNTKEKKLQQVAQTSKPRRKTKKKPLIIILVILVILGLIFGPGHDIEVTVDGFEWERTIKTEEKRKVIEEDWQLPNEGTLINSFQAVHHYNQILDHYETRTRTRQRVTGSEEYVCGKTDMGNGYFEDKYCTRNITESYEEEYEDPVYRQEPVYQTKYKYSIYRWKPAKPLISSGNNHKAEWADTREIKNNHYLRESGRKGIYCIIVKDEENEIHRHEIPEEKWEQLEPGTSLKARRGNATGKYRGLSDETLKIK